MGERPAFIQVERDPPPRRPEDDEPLLPGWLSTALASVAAVVAGFVAGVVLGKLLFPAMALLVGPVVGLVIRRWAGARPAARRAVAAVLAILTGIPCARALAILYEPFNLITHAGFTPLREDPLAILDFSGMSPNPQEYAGLALTALLAAVVAAPRTRPPSAAGGAAAAPAGRGR